MQKIITSILAFVMMANTVSAFSIVDAIQTTHSRGITECTDNQAQNYKAMAPCLYIREAAPRVMVANNYNTRESIYAGRVNPFLKQDLIDTSAWYRTTHATHNGTSIVDMIADQKSRGITECTDNQAQNYKAMAPCLYIREAAPRVMVANNYNTRESIYAGRVNPFLKQDLIDTSTWYRNSSTNTSRSTSVNTSTSTSTSVNTTITLAQLEKVMANKNNLSVRILNNDTAYIAIDSGSIANNSIHTIMPISITDTNNPWRQDVVIVVSYTNNSNLTWNYVVFTMDGAILDGGTMSANINLIKSSVLAHDSNTPTVITPVYTTTATTPVVTTTVAPTTPLSFKINYSLGTQNANGSYNLDSATCNTNGSVDVLWIEQQTANNTFGLGIEINNTFGNQTYKVNKGDKLCCRVSTLKGAYQKAGGCEVVK